MSAKSTKVERTLIKLKDVRLSWPNLFTPRAMESDDGKAKKPEYSANFILDKKKHAKEIALIKAETEKVAKAKWGKVPTGKFRGPIREGSTFVDENDDLKDGYSDKVVGISAKSQSKQQVIRRDTTPADEDEVYGGCYVNAVITLYTWEHPKNGKGISANLGPVQFFRNGERFGNAVIDAGEVFEDLGEEDDGGGNDDADEDPMG